MQELKPIDHLNRLQFTIFSKHQLTEIEEFYKNIMVSDKVLFHFEGNVYKHNCHIWSTENLHVVEEKLIQLQRVHVWLWLWSGDIIGSFFFGKYEATTLAVNREYYRKMLIDWFFAAIEAEDMDNISCQQEAAYCICHNR